MRIAQISDFHYTQITWNPFRLLSKRLLGNLNWLFKRNSAFSREILEPLPQLFEDLNVDLVLLGGDFTTTAAKEEYLIAQQFVNKISQPWIAIPGNHDHYTYLSYKNKHFYTYLSNKERPILCPTHFFTLKDHGIEVHKIALNQWVLALDTARATNLYSSRGYFSEKLENYVKEVLQLIPLNASIIVFNHYPFFQNDVERRTLERGEALMAILQTDPRIRLYLHGHTHRHTIADLQPNGLPVVLDSGSCAEKNKASWNLIDLKEKGCEVSVYKWKENWERSQVESLIWTR